VHAITNHPDSKAAKPHEVQKTSRKFREIQSPRTSKQRKNRLRKKSKVQREKRRRRGKSAPLVPGKKKPDFHEKRQEASKKKNRSPGKKRVQREGVLSIAPIMGKLITSNRKLKGERGDSRILWGGKKGRAQLQERDM